MIASRVQELLDARRHTIPAGLTINSIDGVYFVWSRPDGIGQIIETGFKNTADVTGPAVRDLVEACIDEWRTAQ